MAKFFSAYAAIFLVMLAIDLLWLGVIAKPLYQQGIGHLMAAKPNLVAAGLFYVIFPAGLVLFAVMPNAEVNEWNSVLTSAALFGFFAYATYDLTNLAIMKNWPISLSFIDVAWGTFASTLSAAAGKFVLTRFF
jgi:uncharacterized membrane protein